MQQIVDIAEGGLVTTAQVVEAGIPRARLSDMVKTGDLVRVQRGVYCLADTWEDEFLAAQLRFPKGILSDGTALYLHNYTDRTPFCITMTFPRAYHASSARAAGVEVRTCADEVLGLGLSSVKTPYGNKVRVYDLERTLCDIVRGQAIVDSQLVNPAMKRYAASNSKDVQKLLGYARKLKVERKIRDYLEVLL